MALGFRELNSRRLRLNEAGVLAGVVLLELGEEFGEEETGLAVAD